MTRAKMTLGPLKRAEDAGWGQRAKAGSKQATGGSRGGTELERCRTGRQGQGSRGPREGRRWSGEREAQREGDLRAWRREFKCGTSRPTHSSGVPAPL